jgi:hypothetical protein
MAFLPLLKELSEEKVVLLKPLAASRLPFPLDRIVRLVDAKGNTLGLLLDKGTLEEIEEDLESQKGSLIKTLEKSRGSGRISGKKVKKKIGLK